MWPRQIDLISYFHVIANIAKVKSMAQRMKISIYLLFSFHLIMVGSGSAYPTNVSWDSFNRTIHGRLYAATPFALPCFSNFNGQSIQHNEGACATVQHTYGYG